LIIGNIAILQN